MAATIFERHVERAEKYLANTIEVLTKRATSINASLVNTFPAEEQDVSFARHQLETAVKRLQWFEALPADKQLAAELHERLCRSNHTDACGWLYDVDADRWDGKYSATAEYLGKAQSILADVPLNVAMKVATKL